MDNGYSLYNLAICLLFECVHYLRHEVCKEIDVKTTNIYCLVIVMSEIIQAETPIDTNASYSEIGDAKFRYAL